MALAGLLFQHIIDKALHMSEVCPFPVYLSATLTHPKITVELFCPLLQTILDRFLIYLGQNPITFGAAIERADRLKQAVTAQEFGKLPHRVCLADVITIDDNPALEHTHVACQQNALFSAGNASK